MPKTEESGQPVLGSEVAELERVARTRLGETPEVKERSLSLLRKLIAGELTLSACETKRRE